MALLPEAHFDANQVLIDMSEGFRYSAIPASSWTIRMDPISLSTSRFGMHRSRLAGDAMSPFRFGS